MRNPGSEFEADIVDLSHDGRGVARLNGKTVFIAGALTGERVRARTTRRRRHYEEAVSVELLRRSPDRVEPRCAHFSLCGGCTLQHLSAENQIAAKQEVLLQNLERIGHVRPQRVLPPLAESPWGYRRKARLGVKYVEKKNRVLVGFRETNPRYLADLRRCEILISQVGERLSRLGELLGTLEAHNAIPQIEVAAGDDTVALVFRHLEPLSERDRSRLIAFGQQYDLAIFLQPGGADSLQPLWPASPRLAFKVPEFNLEFEFRPVGFVQINAAINRRMIVQAVELLDVGANDCVLDLFCGLGNFTLPIARRAGSVVGVEGDSGLVMRARENAARNGIANAEFYAADLTQPLSTEPWAKGDFTRLLLDPPRSGADAAIPQLPLATIERIVYVSCHPASLARDAGILVANHGYRLVAAGVMDMFPHTAHVESMAVFERG